MTYINPATGSETETKFLSKTEVLRQMMELLREQNINEVKIRKYEP